MDDKNVNPEETTTTSSTPENQPATDTSAEVTAATVPEAAVSGEVVQKKPSKGGVIAIAIVTALVVGGIVWAVLNNSSETTEFDLSVPAPSAAEVDVDFEALPEVVATINGEEITRADYEAAYMQAATMAAQQGVDPNSAEIKSQIEQQTMERLINTEVLSQASADVTVDAESVAAEIATLEQSFGGPEALAAELANAGITLEDLESDIKTQMQIDAFIQASPEMSVDFAVTQDEKQALYDEVAAQSPDIPAFSEVEAQVEQQLVAEKQQAATQALIDRLVAAASVSTYLDADAG